MAANTLLELRAKCFEHLYRTHIPDQNHHKLKMARALQDCAVLLGDSLTQMQDTPGNLFERFNKAYERRLDILNRGFGGWNSNGTRVLMDHIFAKKGDAANVPVVRLVTIWLGTNDSVLPPKDQTVPLPEFIDNLNSILLALTSPTSPYAIADTPVSIILITPGPCLTSMFQNYIVKWRTVESTRKFRDAVLTIGGVWKERENDERAEREKAGKKADRGWSIETVDFWADLVKKAGGEGEELRPFLTDGLHLTSAGYEVVWEGVSEVIRKKFKGRGLNWEDDADMPKRVPWSGEMDWSRPESIVEGMKLPDFRLKE